MSPYFRLWLVIGTGVAACAATIVWAIIVSGASAVGGAIGFTVIACTLYSIGRIVARAWRARAQEATAARVRIYIPEQFGGLFVICRSPHGSPPRVESGWHVLSVSPTGVVIVDDDSFLKCIEMLEVRDANGKLLPTFASAIQGEHGLYHVVTNTEGWYFFVGRKSEVERLRAVIGSRHPEEMRHAL